MSVNAAQVHFRPGDWVEVRPLPEILATLDASGTVEGLPFMPEMVQYCGRRFQVYRRAEKVFLDGRNTVVRLENAVFLDGIRCDAQSHGGCQMGCLMFWKEAWLRPVDAGKITIAPIAPCSPHVAIPTMKEGKYVCQATELASCGPGMPWWDFGQYVRDYVARKMSKREWIGMLASLACDKIRRACGLASRDVLVGHLAKTTDDSLCLQPGEWVQVKSREEIAATLDTLGRNRGLGFALAMTEFCNGRFRVLRRVERVIVEWSGEMRQITTTVVLDGVTCNGMARRCCPRDCHYLWREAWLRRVEPLPSPVRSADELP